MLEWPAAVPEGNRSRSEQFISGCPVIAAADRRRSTTYTDIRRCNRSDGVEERSTRVIYKRGYTRKGTNWTPPTFIAKVELSRRISGA